MHRLLALGEANVIVLRTSREVIGDVERFARNRNPALLPMLAEIITTANVAITPNPNEATIAFCESLTGYRPDARILAAAIECAADVLLTHDATHLLGNSRIQPPDVAVMVMNPRDCLEWCFRDWRR
jgi:predicted nucleic acid-binding protein